MAGIQLGGLATGLDTDAIISGLLASERGPRTRMVNSQSAVQARQRALTDFSAKLRALGDAASRLGSATTWHDVQTVESNDAAKVSARQLTTAAPGGYTIAVTQLATADQHVYDYTPPGAADTITVGGGSVAVAAGASLDDVVTAINADASLGVFAIAVDGATAGTRALALIARDTGTAHAFTASGAAVAEDTTRARPARDADYTIDGGPVQHSSTNVLANAIPGVELTLRATTAATAVSISTPALDRDAVTGAVQGFVTAYNGLVDAVRAALSEKPVSQPKTAFDAAKGSLYADPTLGSMLDTLRGVLAQAFPDGGAGGTTARLSSLGISTGAATGSMPSSDSLAGKLTLNADALTAALTADPQRVRTLLSGTAGAGGLSQAARTITSTYSQTGGVIDARLQAAGSSLRSLGDQIARFDDRASRREQYLRRQFTAMETAVSHARAQAQDLSNRLQRTSG